MVVVGHPRSGTSLIASRLAAHVGIPLLRETHALVPPTSRPARLAAIAGVASPVRSAELRDRLTAASPAFDCAKHARRASEQVRVQHPSARSFVELLEGLARELGTPAIIEKTPDHASMADHLLDAGAHVIFVVRDPRDVYTSLAEVPWNSLSPTRFAVRWQRYAQLARSIANRPGAIVLRYEDFVVDESAHLQRMSRLLPPAQSTNTALQGATLENDVALGFDPQSEPWKGRVRTPTTAGRIGRWDRGDESMLEIEGIAATNMKAFGYQLSVSAPKGPRASFDRSLARVQEQLLQVSWRRGAMLPPS